MSGLRRLVWKLESSDAPRKPDAQDRSVSAGHYDPEEFVAAQSPLDRFPKLRELDGQVYWELVQEVASFRCVLRPLETFAVALVPFFQVYQ